MTGSSSKLLQIQGKWYQERNKKQGSRLTRRPCTGDRFEILIFEGKKKCWYLQESSKNVCNMDIHFDWQACDSRVKFAFRLRGYSILLFKGQNRIISGRHSLFQFFPLLDASGARALVATQVPQSATRQRCDAMSSCRPKCTFVVHLLFFCGTSMEVAIFSSVSVFHPFVEYQQQWFYRIYPTNDLENDKS